VNVSAIAIKRPVFAVMVFIALMVLGAVGFSRLGTDLFPDVSFPVVVITIPYPGASPSEVEQLVSKPVEDAVVSMNGIDRIRTYSREGVSQTMVLFKLGVDIQEGATQVRERVAQMRYKLPEEVKEPAIARFDVSATPVVIYTLGGGGKSLAETQKIAKDVIKPALEQIDGVAAVDVKGGADREIHVDLSLAKIDALGLSPSAIIAKLGQENMTVPAGHYDEGTREISVRTVGELRTVDEIRDLVVATAADGSGVRLRDIATVEDGWEEQRTRVRANGEPAVSFSVSKQSGANTVAVADAVRAKVDAMASRLPPGMRTSVIIDTSKFIRMNAHEVETAIVFGGAMAVLVVLLFMLDIRSMLISSVALPTSVVATFFLMYALGFSLNMMTLLGLSLAIGLLIDDAVVVRENISKHLERGEDPRTAALEGTKEISLSVLATTLAVVAVFVPVAFMSGLVGQFFRQFGLTITAAVLMSLFVAFTLDPMLSSRFSKAHVVAGAARDPWAKVKAPFLAMQHGIESLYRAVLFWSVRHKAIVGALAIGSLFFMGYVMKLMGSDFVNPEDRGQFVLEMELPPGTSLDETARLSQGAEKKLLEDKNFVTVFATLGLDGQTNKAQWRVVTTPKNARFPSNNSPSPHISELKEQARRIAQVMPEAKIAVSDPNFIEGAATEAPIMVQVRAPTYEQLEPLAKSYQAALERVPGVGDVQVKYSPGQPEVRVRVDREKSAAANVPMQLVAMTLRASMEGMEAGKLRQGKDEVPIRVRLGAQDRGSLEDVMRMTVWTPRGATAARPGGAPMTIADLATLERGEGPAVIEREGRERQIVIWAFPKGRSLGEIVPDMTAAFAKIPMPPGASYHLDGQVRQMNETNDSMGIALLLGVVFIYIVLASQFESFIHPFTIMLTLPLALVGAIVALFLAGTTLAMGAMIGIILLMGLVTKNAILLLDRALVRVREHGETPMQAILEAGPERLRPILMTSAAMILGMLPTAVSNGEGSEFRAPMAVAVIGGVISSTLLSLVVVPAFYLAIEGAKARIKGWLGLGATMASGETGPKPYRAPAE
jgi:hydrophobe/amphiphile efflux-1 (HAE1) family protein